MTTLTKIEISPRATDVSVTEDLLIVHLEDGRIISVPTEWYPRLSHGSPAHLQKWELSGSGHGIHWPELDEDISVQNILFGQPSGEGPKSFSRWLQWYSEKLPN